MRVSGDDEADFDFVVRQTGWGTLPVNRQGNAHEAAREAQAVVATCEPVRSDHPWEPAARHRHALLATLVIGRGSLLGRHGRRVGHGFCRRDDMEPIPDLLVNCCLNVSPVDRLRPHDGRLDLDYPHGVPVNRGRGCVGKKWFSHVATTACGLMID